MFVLHTCRKKGAGDAGNPEGVAVYQPRANEREFHERLCSPEFPVGQDRRPSHGRCFTRRSVEAEMIRGLWRPRQTAVCIADVVARPLLPPSYNPGRRPCSLHSHCLALGWYMATPSGNAVNHFPPSFNGKPKATACVTKHRRPRLAVKRRRKMVHSVARRGGHIPARGKAMGVQRALPPPWVIGSRK